MRYIRRDSQILNDRLRDLVKVLEEIRDELRGPKVCTNSWPDGLGGEVKCSLVKGHEGGCWGWSTQGYGQPPLLTVNEPWKMV